MKRYEILGATLGVMLALTGCAAAGGVEDPNDKLGEDGLGKEDRWNSANNPERFDGEFNYHASDLPTQGTAERESWPSTYWPTYDDSINARWNGTDLSPAEKYDRAFNGWTPSAEFAALRPFDRNRPVPGTDWDTTYYQQLGPLATHISTSMGNGRDRAQAVAANGRPTSGDWETETWWGLCHAWVPAAILEDRPLRAVEHNGVRFEVGDIEALLIAAYNRAPADMIGGRCNAGSGETMVERDAQGRPVDVECRDTNPGSMHVIVTNYLGLSSRGFAMDRTYDYEVWNQPVVGYEITQQTEVTAAQANQILGATGETYAYNPDARTLYEVRMSLHWITESHASTTPGDSARYTRTDYLHYILEVDSAGKIIGGEWAGNSRNSHPDFLWNPRRLTRSSVPYLDLANVRMLVQRSRETTMPPPSGNMLTAMGAGGIAIPDNNATGITSAATLSGAGVVTTVAVDLNLTHTYIGDLIVTLSHGGVSRVIHNREGGGTDNIVRAIEVTGFDGLAAAGEWTLSVADRAGRDTGTLVGWTLRVGTGAGEPVDPGTGTAMRFAGRGGVAIPDNVAAGITSTASVSGANEGTVSVEVAITHTYIGDLTVEAVAPTGQTFTLHNRQGGGDDNLRQTFALDAVGSRFTGSPNGTWTLRVSDTAGADTGTLDSWAVLVQ